LTPIHFDGKILTFQQPTYYNKGGFMGYTNVALKDKITDMYPEILKHGIVASLDFDETKNAYIVKFKKDKHELTTHLEKKDADECMDGIKCVYLGVQVAQFLKNFETT
jgi:hypothetical protein